MPISPHQVTSNANSKLCMIDLILNDVALPSAQRMAKIVRLADEFRSAVAGSTADPLRS